MHSDKCVEALLLAKERAISEINSGGIGTLGEKLIHRTLKYYFEPNSDFHEIKFLGSVADIKNQDGIIEIQTRAFEKLVPKLERFLEECTVTVVYPITERKRICRIDSETGEMLSSRLSPKRGNLSDALAEISKIRRFILHKNLKILLVSLDAVETRMLSKSKKVGRKKTDKVDCEPISINSIIELREAKDFVALLPENLPPEFSSSDFEKLTRLRAISLHSSLALLVNVGVLDRSKMGGRAYIYSVNPDFQRLPR